MDQISNVNNRSTTILTDSDTNRSIAPDSVASLNGVSITSEKTSGTSWISRIYQQIRNFFASSSVEQKENISTVKIAQVFNKDDVKEKENVSTGELAQDFDKDDVEELLNIAGSKIDVIKKLLDENPGNLIVSELLNQASKEYTEGIEAFPDNIELAKRSVEKITALANKAFNPASEKAEAITNLSAKQKAHKDDTALTTKLNAEQRAHKRELDNDAIRERFEKNKEKYKAEVGIDETDEDPIWKIVNKNNVPDNPREERVLLTTESKSSQNKPQQGETVASTVLKDFIKLKEYEKKLSGEVKLGHLENLPALRQEFKQLYENYQRDLANNPEAARVVDLIKENNQLQGGNFL